MSNGPNDPALAFEAEKRESIATYGHDKAWRQQSSAWMIEAFRKRYMYNFTWMGRPIIQMPADVMGMSELIWSVKPDLIIETGIAHGGSLVFSASMLALIDLCEANESNELLDPKMPARKVLGVDIDIRPHNRAAIERHPMSHRIDMIQGSSIDPAVVDQVRNVARGYQRIMVCLDSSHTHAHVLAELEAYAPLTSVGSYCIVFDTIIEDMPVGTFPDRPWSPGNSPKTAIQQFLQLLKDEGRVDANGKKIKFELDQASNDKLMLTAVPGGYLRRV